jgi:Holliday junction resolvase RusA-like endonuclease
MKVEFTILGELCSMKNSRQIVVIKGNPSVIKSSKARAYERTALLQIPSHARIQLQGPVRATLRVFYASERPDLDESLLLDILQSKYEWVEGRYAKQANGSFVAERRKELVRAGVYLNDRQVREKHVFHFIDRGNPRVEVEIEPMVAQQAAMSLETVADGDPF